MGSMLGGNILIDGAAEGGGKDLNATADAKDGELAVGGEPGEEELAVIAAGVYAAKLGDGLLTEDEWIDVAAPREDEGIDGVED